MQIGIQLAACQRLSTCNSNNNNNQATLDLEEHSEPSLSHQQQTCLALVLSGGYPGVNWTSPLFHLLGPPKSRQWESDP